MKKHRADCAVLFSYPKTEKELAQVKLLSAVDAALTAAGTCWTNEQQGKRMKIKSYTGEGKRGKIVETGG